MKKIALSLAAILLCTAALIACENNNAESDSDTAAESTTESASVAESATESETVSETAADEKITYTVTVVDQDGNPVSGVYVQLCTSENCLMPNATDASGVVTFKQNPGVTYQAKLNMLPEGYTGDTETYVDFTDNAVTITITKN